VVEEAPRQDHRTDHEPPFGTRYMLHYLLKMLENMQRLDRQWVGSADDDGGPT
jgi:hypothetical protein